MDWLEVQVTTHTQSVEAVSEMLMELGAKGVSIEDPADFYQLNEEQLEWLQVQQQQLFETEDVLVKAYFSTDTWTHEMLQEITVRITELKEFGLEIGKGSVEVTTVGEEDWADAWKAYYFPVRVTRYLTVVPSWTEYEPAFSDEKLIVLDPGLAFGTGTHPTTQLSLMALEQYIRGGERMLDVGTGSGVLSIAAKALGVQEIVAFDIDELATRVSKENIALNEYATNITVKENNLLVGVDEQVDIIVANILAEILVQMPQDAYRNLTEDGLLILSGVIASKYDTVVAAYEEVGFVVKQTSRMGEWHAIVFEKKRED